RLQAQGVTEIVATHDLGLASSRFDRVLLIRRRVIAYGTPADVFDPAVFREAYGGHVGVFRDGAFFVGHDHYLKEALSTDCRGLTTKFLTHYSLLVTHP